MELEHCANGDSDVEFTPPNYPKPTTPSKEYFIVTIQEKGREASVGERRVLHFEDLRQHPDVEKAGLGEQEVIAVILYTGPMV